MTKSELERVALAHLETLYRVARRLAPDLSAAEDLVGATLLAAFRAPEQCDGRFPLAWLIQIMRNRHYQDLRKIRASVVADPRWEQIADADAHRRLMDRLQSVDLLRALDRLPEEYRLVIVLCDMEELDYAEAAAALQVPVGTIRSRLSRGRRMLQGFVSAPGGC